MLMQPSIRIARLADIVLVGGGVVCLLAFFYFVYWYDWTREREFTGVAGIILQIVLPAVLASALFASLRFGPTYRATLAIFCISSLFSIYSLELLLLAFRKLGAHFDTRERLEVVADLRNRGIDAVPAVFPSVLWDVQRDGNVKSVISINSSEVLPLGGIAKKLTVMCNESGEWITYRSDEHGFNNPEGIWQSRDISVAAVGDSFAFGACVPSDKNFVALIRKKYPATLNLGINGAGPLVELAAMKEFLPVVRPKVTLWFYLEQNDHLELNQEKRSGLLMRYLKDNFNQRLIRRQTEIDEALAQYVDTRRKLAEAKTVHAYLKYGLDIIKLTTVRKKLGLVYGTSKDEASFGPDELQIRLFREILQNAHAFINTWNGRMYFVYLPAWRRYIDPPAASDNRDAILALARGLKIPVIDIHQAFQAHGDPLRLFPFRRLGHYNEEGHRLVAETVLHHVSSHSSPCEIYGSWSRDCLVRDRYPHEQRAQ
ncbi:MAG: hypothetical protein WAT66_00085 [Actinomycetota bacterium]